MIQIANILLTRRCNLNCSYCNLVKDYPDKPVEYPDMKYYREHELTGEQWCDIIQRLYAHNPNIFLIFYGGEPILYHDLDKILRYCNTYNINYTVISNNTGDVVKKRILELYELTGRFRGFTSSVDPIVMIPEGLIGSTNKYSDMLKKSRQGLANLIEIKKTGLSDDVVAEITILKETIPYLYDTVLKLSENGIVSSITAVDCRKSPYYDFSGVEGRDSCLLEKTPELKQIFDRLVSEAESGKLKIHIPRVLYELYNCLPSNYKCELNKDITNVSLEPDGSFRLCLRIRGVYTPELPYYEAISTTGVLSDKLIGSIAFDYNKYCLGCNWTCPMMSLLYFNRIVKH